MASWIGLVNQLQGLEYQFSLVLMEAAMKLAYFTGTPKSYSICIQS